MLPSLYVNYLHRSHNLFQCHSYWKIVILSKRSINSIILVAANSWLSMRLSKISALKVVIHLEEHPRECT